MTFLKQLSQRLDGLDRTLSRMTPPPLRADERQLHTERVDRITFALPTPGLLILTTERLIFVPANRAFLPITGLRIREVECAAP